MTKTYSYDPSKIDDKGLNQMRFELGDTFVDDEGQSCALCDEEYTVLINKAINVEKQGWSHAKLYCLQGMLMQFAHETNYSADGMSVSLASRYDKWKELYYQLQRSLAVPTANKSIIGKNASDGGHYFYTGMHDNPRVSHCRVQGYNERVW